ncbi:hypothetical protein [Sphingopyxis macrogoltabida]|uniref:Uncharacterized protein n=1 Tax=Sphingopyxis macrogoltabida TaxID=33050 RepID=A0AAC8Z3D9_SPHMC|nr:hypothetical protein [Sphingopyxis macrogoltabida]ALJ14525.1 hypothetical protein LH19_16765 [Sphingopyxis macrogoltabida]AMU90787.1 hypothetical protein ATM17_17335 [Sphingopyxis macrogoltabida]
MNLLKKAAVSLAATSMIVAPVAASAAPALDGARATSVVSDQNEMEGNGWLLGVLAAIAFGVGLYFLIDNDKDAPTSP